MYITTEIDVELDDFDTEDLLEELESRGSLPVTGNAKEIVEFIYLKRRLGQDYQTELDQLIYTVLGKFI